MKQSFVTLFYSFFPDIYDLINYTAFSEAIFVTICVAALLWLRYTRPDMDRPIRVPIILPVIFMVICLFLVTFPIFASPYETGISLLITLSGIPLYFATVYWDPKPRLYKEAICKSAFIANLTRINGMSDVCLQLPSHDSCRDSYSVSKKEKRRKRLHNSSPNSGICHSDGRIIAHAEADIRIQYSFT